VIGAVDVPPSPATVACSVVDRHLTFRSSGLKLGC